jgi:hypothetical protein
MARRRRGPYERSSREWAWAFLAGTAALVGACTSAPDGNGAPPTVTPLGGRGNTVGSGGGSSEDSTTASVSDADVVVEFGHVVAPDAYTYSRDAIHAFFFPEPIWSSVGGVLPVGTCSAVNGLQTNIVGTIPVDTGSSAIELVRTAPTPLRVSIPLGTVPNWPEYTFSWQHATLADSPWASGASFDVADADATPPLELANVIAIPAERPTLQAPAPNATVSLAQDLHVEWVPGDGLRVDILVDNRLDCAGADTGSMVIQAQQLAAVAPNSAGSLRITRTHSKRLQRGGRIVHSMYFEGAEFPVEYQ